MRSVYTVHITTLNGWIKIGFLILKWRTHLNWASWFSLNLFLWTCFKKKWKRGLEEDDEWENHSLGDWTPYCATGRFPLTLKVSTISLAGPVGCTNRHLMARHVCQDSCFEALKFFFAIGQVPCAWVWLGTCFWGRDRGTSLTYSYRCHNGNVEEAIWQKGMERMRGEIHKHR